MSSKYLGWQFDIHGGGMDLQFPHHECEIAQSRVAHHGELMARYWIHNNMITINGKKMGKSYNNVIKLSEMFNGQHPLLEKAYSPMTIRFFILQTHYRSTLDFSNEALQAAEKGLQRLWSAYGISQQLVHPGQPQAGNDELDKQITRLCEECAGFMDDDFNTAKVLANLFELAPVVNSLKTGQISMREVSAGTFELLKKTWQTYVADVLGLQQETAANDDKLAGVVQVLVDIRREAKSRKDYATSDRIRNQLQELGITLKDEKDGSISWTVS
jgi:cysteinyl-tRNA synthetase